MVHLRKPPLRGANDPADLARVVEELPDVVFRYRLRPTPGYDYISPSVERLTGYSPRQFYDDPDFDVKIVHPDDQSLLMETIALRRDGIVRLRWVHRDGGVVCLELHLAAMRDERGEVIALAGTARDVTARVVGQGAAENEIVRALMSTASDPIFLCDREGVLIECNEAFARIFGRPRQEIVGETVYSRWPRIADRRLRQIQRAVKSRRPVRFDEQLNGRYYSVAINPVTDEAGEVQALAVFGRDITRRIRAELKLRASEERFRILYQDNPTMYFTVDTAGTVLSVNAFGAHQLGYEPEELIGQPVEQVFHPKDRKAVARQLKACLKQRGETASWEFRKVRKNGEVIWVKEAARATQGPDGSTIVLIVCEDITERRQMEEELQRLREEIESKVEEMLEEKADPYNLTFRQLTVLHLVAQGKSDKEIGLALGISPLTVNTHVSRALRKMGASSRTEAGVRAVREGLIQ